MNKPQKHPRNLEPIASDPRWAAVAARDPAADGTFWYSVDSTGVYCRPSCPSRRARPEHIRFHASREQAEAAGYRPCRRCRPDLPPLAERRAELVARACRLIERAESPPPLAELAARLGVSGFHLHRIFKVVTGLTPRAYAQAHRARRVRERLEAGEAVTSAIYDAGFNAPSRFYDQAGQTLGMPPARYRAGGAGERIRFAVGECSLGAILVAATARGVCAISLGEDPDVLVRQLQDRFPRAELLGADAQFEALVATVIGFVEQPATALSLPLDVRGTAFQQRVWQALGEIPPGVTASYAEIAARIGAPAAVRAVAGACASNTLAVAIPCHRVVRRDGSLGGYRWGVARKQALLEREACS